MEQKRILTGDGTAFEVPLSGPWQYTIEGEKDGGQTLVEISEDEGATWKKAAKTSGDAKQPAQLRLTLTGAGPAANVTMTVGRPKAQAEQPAPDAPAE